MEIDIKELKRQAKLELARRNFGYFCYIRAPKFYKNSRKYLKKLTLELQTFLDSDDDLCVINLPPRFGKSRTAVMLAEWVLGNDIEAKIMTGSYNETLSTTFSKNVRNGISEVKADEDKIIYSDIFPTTKIKRGDGAMNLWSLEGGYNNYLATSPSGTATGFGASLLIIDDLIKNAQEAYTESNLEGHWDWFTNTMLSRLEEGAKIIIIMTRWASNDLAGKVLAEFAEEGKKVRHITMKALQDDNTMLCDEILSRESYDMKTKLMGLDIASANYQQIPIDIKGRLYSAMKTYDKVPSDESGNHLFSGIYSYCDTADEGADWLCHIIFGLYEGCAYVLDVYYTKEAMEITEPEVARKELEFNVGLSYIESNNGGRGFARNVERILHEKYYTRKTKVLWFHQSQNKIARILSNSTRVMNNIFFPVNWKDRWPDYYRDMMKYQREGKNEHDDAPDATTGVMELIDGKLGKARANHSGKGAR